MTKEEIIKADLLDILFENRNKNYGAYDLRKHYNYRLSIALVTSLAGAFLAFLLIRPNNSNQLKNLITPDTVQLTDIILPPEEKPIEEPEEVKPQPKPQEPPQASINNSRIEIVEDNLVDETTVPTQEEMVDKVISNVTTDVTVSNDVVTTLPTNGNGIAEVIHEEPLILDVDDVEQKPEFPGGLEGLRNFLSKHLRSPNELEANEIRTVYVKFIVSTEGEVTGFTILRSAGNVFDNEVLRVLKKMPKWMPAKQSGKKVAVTFTQPVTFKGLED